MVNVHAEREVAVRDGERQLGARVGQVDDAIFLVDVRRLGCRQGDIHDYPQLHIAVGKDGGIKRRRACVSATDATVRDGWRTANVGPGRHRAHGGIGSQVKRTCGGRGDTFFHEDGLQYRVRPGYDIRRLGDEKGRRFIQRQIDLSALEDVRIIVVHGIAHV